MKRSRIRALVIVAVTALSGCCHLGGDEDTYDPCEEKEEGDQCKLCAPDDPDCIETAVIKVCNAVGECGTGTARDDAERPTHDH